MLELSRLCQKEKVTKIIIGQSTNYDGSDNPLMAEVKILADNLTTKIGLPIIFEPEFYSSQEAKRIIGKDDLYDARAAALILKSYIDKQRYL